MRAAVHVEQARGRSIEDVEAGRLDLGSMASGRITLDQINDAFRAMQDGEVIRSVITEVR